MRRCCNTRHGDARPALRSVVRALPACELGGGVRLSRLLTETEAKNESMPLMAAASLAAARLVSGVAGASMPCCEPTRVGDPVRLRLRAPREPRCEPGIGRLLCD